MAARTGGGAASSSVLIIACRSGSGPPSDAADAEAPARAATDLVGQVGGRQRRDHRRPARPAGAPARRRGPRGDRLGQRRGELGRRGAAPRRSP